MRESKLFFAAIVAAGLAAADVSADKSGAGESAAAGGIVIENAACRLVLDRGGFARSLVDLASGEELLLSGVRVPFATLAQERPYDNEYKLMLPAKPWTHRSNRIERHGDELRIGFEDEFDILVLKLRETPDYLGFKLFRIDYEAPDFGDKRKTEIDAISICRLPLRRRAHFGATLNVTWDERSAAALLAADCATRVEGDTDIAGGALLWAGTELRSGLNDLSAALVVQPQGRFLDAIDRFEGDFGLPRGVASRRRADIAESCYFATGFRPQDLDLHLSSAREGGFGLFMIDIMDVVKTIGTYELKPDYPHGLADIAALGERIRAAGLRTAFHGFSTKIHWQDPMATTNLDPRINVVCEFHLVENADAAATELTVEGNAGLLRTDHPRRRLFAADRELIEFTAIVKTPNPAVVRLTGCTRGARGTAAAAHARGECLRHLDVDDWPIWLRINPYTSLTADQAERIAALWKAFGAVMFYFDGAEDVPPPYWHHVPRAQYALYERLDPKPLFCETALKSHFGWHLNSRGNAFDIFAPERIRQAMCACNLRCAAQDADDFTVVDFGWLNLRLPERNPKQAARPSWLMTHNVNLGLGMQSDHFEYIFSKALAWDSPVTVQFSRKTLKEHPHARDILASTRRWSEARRERRFSEAERKAMRDPERLWSFVDFGSGKPEPVACRQVTADAERPIRAFSFVRGKEAGIVYWDIFSEMTPEVKLSVSSPVRNLTDGGRRIILSPVSEEDLVRAFRADK